MAHRLGLTHWSDRVYDCGQGIAVVVLYMKRLAAISLVLLTPGMLVLFMTLCCAFAMSMPECGMPPACHEPLKVSSGNCCQGLQTALANKALNGGQFTLAPPSGELVATLPAGTTSLATWPAASAPVSSSPPILNLRV